MGVPSVTASSSSCTFHSYQTDLNASPVLVFSGRGNLYGFLVEDNSGSDIFVHVYDAASAASVTFGVTVPVFTFRVKADNAFGKDVNDSPYKFFALGCVVVVSDARNGGVSPTTGATGQFWFVNRQP